MLTRRVKARRIGVGRRFQKAQGLRKRQNGKLHHMVRWLRTRVRQINQKCVFFVIVSHLERAGAPRRDKLKCAKHAIFVLDFLRYHQSFFIFLTGWYFWVSVLIGGNNGKKILIERVIEEVEVIVLMRVASQLFSLFFSLHISKFSFFMIQNFYILSIFYYSHFYYYYFQPYIYYYQKETGWQKLD